MLVVNEVREEGLQFDIIIPSGDEIMDLLSPKECLTLIKDIRNNLFEWSKFTGKRIDWESLK